MAGGGFDDGEFLTGVIVDITAQELFEEELGSLVDRYRLLTEVSPDLVIVHQNGLLVYGNRAAVRAWGEAQNQDTRLGVAEGGHGESPVGLVTVGAALELRDLCRMFPQAGATYTR